MSRRDNAAWLKMWRNQQIDFHQPRVQAGLLRFLPELALVPGGRILVPLCGKTLDMLWLAGQGHPVVGVELSPVAVKAFFSENGLIPTRKRVGDFSIWECGLIQLLCGDYFRLDADLLGPVDLVYDHGALSALPGSLRKAYVQQLLSVTGADCPVLISIIEDLEPDMPATRAADIDEEITALYAADFRIRILGEDTLPAPDGPPTDSNFSSRYRTYLMTRCPGPDQGV